MQKCTTYSCWEVSSSWDEDISIWDSKPVDSNYLLLAVVLEVAKIGPCEDWCLPGRRTILIDLYLDTQYVEVMNRDRSFTQWLLLASSQLCMSKNVSCLKMAVSCKFSWDTRSSGFFLAIRASSYSMTRLFLARSNGCVEDSSTSRHYHIVIHFAKILDVLVIQVTDSNPGNEIYNRL